MWLRCINRIQAKLALASLLGLLVIIAGCARNGSEIAESADESTSSKVANATEEKQSYLSRLASLRKREVVEDQPLIRDAILNRNEEKKDELEIKNPFGQLVVNQALIESTPKTQPTQENMAVASQETTAVKEAKPTNPFAVSQTKPKAIDKNRFMSMDQFLATVESSPKPPKKETVEDSNIAKATSTSPFPDFDSTDEKNKTEEKKSPFSFMNDADDEPGFAFLADAKADKKSETKKKSLDWNPESDAKLWTPAVEQKGTSVDPAFAQFNTETKLNESKIEVKDEEKTNPLEKLVANKIQKTKTTNNSAIDPAFANFKIDETDENTEEKIPGLNLAEMKSPFESEEDSTNIGPSESALSKLRADLEEKAADNKQKALVASSDERVRSVIQRLLKSSESLMEDGHLVSAKQFASEAKILADQSDFMFGPNDLHPDEFLKKISDRMIASTSPETKIPVEKTIEVQNTSLSKNSDLANIESKKATSKKPLEDAKSNESNELPLIVSSPLKEYRAKPGSGFNVAMVRSNAPVSLATFITNVPDEKEAQKEQRTPLFDFEKEHKQTLKSKTNAISISSSKSKSSTDSNRSLILKSPELERRIPEPEKKVTEKSFLPNSINLDLPDINEDAPMPKLDLADASVMLPATDSTRDMELKTQKTKGAVSAFQFPQSLYDGSRGPVIPMLASFLGGAFLIMLLLYFRRS